MDTIIMIFNSVQPASAVPGIWNLVVPWPSVSPIKIAFQWPCISCCISFHPFMCFLPYGDDKLDQNFNLTFLFPSQLRKSSFCVPGQQNIPSCSWTWLLGHWALAQTMRCYRVKKPLCFASEVKHIELLENTFYPILFILIFFLLDIFLVSSTEFKGFIRLQKERTIKK